MTRFKVVMHALVRGIFDGGTLTDKASKDHFWWRYLMNGKSAFGLKVTLVALMAIYPSLGTLGTAKAAPAAGAVQTVSVKTGTLKGVLIDQATNKPIANLKLTVFDKSGKQVFSTVTDKNGKYELPGLKPGQYRLTVGDGVELKLNVGDMGTTTNLRVVMPKQGHGLAPGLVKGAAVGGAKWTFVAIAGLTAAILVPSGFAVAAAVDSDDDAHN